MRTSAEEEERLRGVAPKHGLPPPPVRPVEGECCERGCDPCIWDYYERACARYRERHAIDSA